MLGVDEAGYGPNLGPLVITATLWKTPGSPARCNPWELLEEAVVQSPCREGRRLHVADSKQVYTSGKGLAPLERPVLAALALLGVAPASFGELRRALTPHRANDPDSDDIEPWYVDENHAVPAEVSDDHIADGRELLRTACDRGGFELRAIRSEVVYTPRFNRLLEAWGTKGAVLSRLTLQLVRSLWDPEGEEPGLVIADKHGGRNRYQELLLEVSDGAMVVSRGESRDVSQYRVGKADFRFQTRAEEHLPTALASMVSKYVREMAMLSFNRWWTARLPEVRPTQGYPEDARRFRNDVAQELERLQLAETVYWRQK